VRLWSDYLYLSQLIGRYSAPDATIVARKPTLTALYSGRRTIDYPMYRDFERQRRHILENEIDYILLDGLSRDTYTYLAPFIKARQDAFQVYSSKGNAYVLRVLRDTLEIDKTGLKQ